jgi:hypothetical protein
VIVAVVRQIITTVTIAINIPPPTKLQAISSQLDYTTLSTGHGKWRSILHGVLLLIEYEARSIPISFVTLQLSAAGVLSMTSIQDWLRLFRP